MIDIHLIGGIFLASLLFAMVLTWIADVLISRIGPYSIAVPGITGVSTATFLWLIQIVYWGGENRLGLTQAVAMGLDIYTVTAVFEIIKYIGFAESLIKEDRIVKGIKWIFSRLFLERVSSGSPTSL